jgi:hypothetical protein
MDDYNDDPFAEFNKIDEDMKNLRDELLKLCRDGNFREAEKRANEEMAPLHHRWLESLRKSLIDIKKHPNLYKPN